jgi:hypothetical protein
MVRGPRDGLEGILVLGTLGAPRRTALRGRRGRKLEEAEPEPVPTSRATVIRPEPFETADEAQAWLDGLRRDKDARKAELDRATAILNRAMHAQRVASADPAAPDTSPARALVVRLGFGAGEAVAGGRYQSAWELPRGGLRTRRSMEAPEQRFAELLTGREEALPAEDLVLRARADLDGGRSREAALQARVALESLLATLPPHSRDRDDLEEQRSPVAQAANAALTRGLDGELADGLHAAVRRMETALRRHRMGP